MFFLLLGQYLGLNQGNGTDFVQPRVLVPSASYGRALGLRGAKLIRNTVFRAFEEPADPSPVLVERIVCYQCSRVGGVLL